MIAVVGQREIEEGHRVCASVLAMAIALSWGISLSFWTGFAGYVPAPGALIRVSRTA